MWTSYLEVSMHNLAAFPSAMNSREFSHDDSEPVVAVDPGGRRGLLQDARLRGRVAVAGLDVLREEGQIAQIFMFYEFRELPDMMSASEGGGRVMEKRT